MGRILRVAVRGTQITPPQLPDSLMPDTLVLMILEHQHNPAGEVAKTLLDQILVRPVNPLLN